MKNFISILFIAYGLLSVSIIGISKINDDNNIEKIELPQPNPLILDKDSNFILQPIIENIDIKGYETLFTLKLYYKDILPNPIYLENKDSLTNYCSDQTVIKLWLGNNTEIEIYSIKRMSCKILALFNLTKQEHDLLKKYPLYKIEITNKVTDSKFLFDIRDTHYLVNLLNKYPHWLSSPSR
jgi:hypothetical protein